ncbi:MAG: hypothetical protein HVN34_03650 [Methanobacteriaceae archaeon]|jgi:hypothetical protein|nr:hypothetical protein [Methanobacteriaceae archaeon]
MEIEEKDLQELQEKLIPLYKFVSQEKLYEKFFFEDSNLVRPYKYKNKLIEELVDMDDSVDFLKTCIMEVEELKGTKRDEEIFFIDILEEQDTEVLFRKYGLENLEDVQDLDLSDLLEYF